MRAIARERSCGGDGVELDAPRIDAARAEPYTVPALRGARADDIASDQCVCRELAILVRAAHAESPRAYPRGRIAGTARAPRRRVTTVSLRMLSSSWRPMRALTGVTSASHRPDSHGVSTGTWIIARCRPRCRAYSRIRSTYEARSAPPISIDFARLDRHLERPRSRYAITSSIAIGCACRLHPPWRRPSREGARRARESSRTTRLPGAEDDRGAKFERGDAHAREGFARPRAESRSAARDASAAASPPR